MTRTTESHLLFKKVNGSVRQRNVNIMNSVQVENVSTERQSTRSAREEGRPLPLSIPDLLTPEQFFQHATDSASVWTGERRLMFAVLHNAVASLLRYQHDYTPHGRRLFKEAHDWFWSAQAWGLYSFESICSHLYLDAGYIRRGLEGLYDPTTVSFVPVRKAPCHVHSLTPHHCQVWGEKVRKPY